MVDETALHLALPAVQGQGEEPLVLHPEALVEGALEARGGLRQPLRALHVAELPVHGGEAPLGVVHVALRLGERHGALRRGAVVVHDGVLRVAPALVAQADARAALVLHEPVAVGVARAVDPRQRRVDGRRAQLEPVQVAGPHGELGDQQQPQRRRVHRAVVRRVRDGAEGGQLAAPQLVHDLAGLLLAEGVVGRALAAGQERDRRPRPAQVQQQRLEPDERHLAAERRDEPRHAGERHAVAVDHRAQHAQVLLAAAQRPVQLLVVGEDVGGVRLPALVLVAQRPDARVELPAGLSRRLRGDHLHVVAQHGAPARGQVQAEPRPALLDRLRAVVEADHRLAGDLVQAQVRQRQRAVTGLGRQPRAAAPAPAAAHLEEVGEVGVEVQVQHQVHLALVVVLHLQQLVEAVGDEARAAHVDARLRQHVPVRGARLEVGELHRRRIAAVGAGAQQHRLPPRDG